MAATLLLIAGMLAAPQADISFSRRVQQNYPPWAVREGQQTAYSVEFAVLPDGRVARCNVLESVGSYRLAAETCAQTIGLKLTPATDAEGKPIHGILRTVISMWLDTGRAPKAIREFTPQPDVELTVNRLPDDEDRLDMEVALLVSPEGAVTECSSRETRNAPVAPEAYVAAACDQAKGWRGQVLQGPNGVALPYVTNLRVRFAQSVAPEG